MFVYISKLASQPSCSIHKVEKHSESADLRQAAEAVPAADGSAPWTAAAGLVLFGGVLGVLSAHRAVKW